MINNDLHHNSIAFLSYRSVTGKYIHGAQKIERFIDKKVGWVASSIFTRIAACGVPLAAMANLIYDPCKRVQSEGYAEGINRCKQMCGDITAMTCGAAWTVLFGSWSTTDIDLETIEDRSEEFILECLKAGANPHYIYNGPGPTVTPLLKACAYAYLEVVKVLIDA